MNEEKIKERLNTLASLILKHNILYHQKDKPEISDEKFDKLVRENNNLEKIIFIHFCYFNIFLF